MSQLTFRHKPIRLFVWITCFLTFYLGFNQQVMCFELKPGGGIYKLHLQLIECNPLNSSIPPATNHTGMPMADISSTGPSGNGCLYCRDFRLSFKRYQGIDLSNLTPLLSFFSADYPIFPNNLLATIISKKEQSTCIALNCIPKSNSSMTISLTTVLLI